MKCTEMKPGRSYDVLLRYNQGIQEAVQELVDKEDIENGYISAGLGGFDSFVLQYADGENDRWQNSILQLSSVGGFIEQGQVQVYGAITQDGTEKRTRSGAVENGTTRLFYGELFVQELLPL